MQHQYDRAANDVSSPGGRIATHLILAVMTDTGASTFSLACIYETYTADRLLNLTLLDRMILAVSPEHSYY